MKTIYYLIIAICILGGCQPSADTPNEKSKSQPSGNLLNISILIDLSDRIKQNKEKDKELIKSAAELFNHHIESKNIYFIRDKMKVLFYPEPTNERINTLAESLNIELNPDNREELKEQWHNLSSTYTENIDLLYKYAKEEGEKNGYPGSDIWRFFTNKVSDYCIEKDPEYRNILIIFTDGYMYHKNSYMQQQNRTSYLTAPFISKSGFRNNTNWEKKFEEGDYGFISKRDDLNDLEIIVLEIAPSQKHRNDDEIIKRYWGKWFEEMNVKRFKLYTTDLPSNTKQLVKLFISN
ncbi:MAG: hypothetical protein K8S00_10800 [Bacteroidales bacterium]|nr:hypothetical protein [Bacteroidales bacterium]